MGARGVAVLLLSMVGVTRAFAQENPCHPVTHMRPPPRTYFWIAWREGLESLQEHLKDVPSDQWMKLGYHEYFESPAGTVGHRREEMNQWADAMDKLSGKYSDLSAGTRCPITPPGSLDSTPVRMVWGNCWAAKNSCLPTIASAIQNLAAANQVAQCVDDLGDEVKDQTEDLMQKLACDAWMDAHKPKPPVPPPPKPPAPPKPPEPKPEPPKPAAPRPEPSTASNAPVGPRPETTPPPLTKGQKAAEAIGARWQADQKQQQAIAAAGKQMEAALGISTDVSAAVGPDMDVNQLAADFAALGQWLVTPSGRVWLPPRTEVGKEFTPYGTNGHWVYSDLGWTWVSGYSWGWAPFHYGTWTQVQGQWAWQPGSTWAPAWVSWSGGEGFVGWAPIGPKGSTPPPGAFVFAKAGRFTDPHLGDHLVGPADVHVKLEGLPSPVMVRGYPVAPVNAGPPPELIERAIGSPLRAVSIGAVERAAPPTGHAGLVPPAEGSAQSPFAARRLSGDAVQELVHAQPRGAAAGFQPTTVEQPWARRGQGETRAFAVPVVAGPAAVVTDPAMRASPSATPSYAPSSAPSAARPAEPAFTSTPANRARTESAFPSPSSEPSAARRAAQSAEPSFTPSRERATTAPSFPRAEERAGTRSFEPEKQRSFTSPREEEPREEPREESGSRSGAREEGPERQNRVREEPKEERREEPEEGSTSKKKKHPY